MAILATVGSNEDKNFMQQLIDERFLKAARPSPNKGITILRFVPEVADDGSILPMVKSMTPGGPDISNLTIESVSTNVGSSAKFTGFNRASDLSDDSSSFDQVFPLLFIRLRSMQKKKELDALGALGIKVRDILHSDKDTRAALGNARDMAIGQCVITQFNDKPLDKPQAKQAVFLTSTAAQALSEVCAKAHERGIDLFSPSEGCEIRLVPEKLRGLDSHAFNAEIGNPVPLNEDVCRKLWVPWESALKRTTFDEQIKAAVRCFGQDVVALVWPDEVARLFPSKAAAAAVEKAVTTELPAAAATEAVSEPQAKAEVAGAAAELQIDLDAAPMAMEDDGGDDESTAGVSADAPATGAASGPASAEELAAQYENLLDD